MSFNPSLSLRSVNVPVMSCEPAGIGCRIGWSAPGRVVQHHPQLIQRRTPLPGQAALALNGTAGVPVSGKEPPSYAAQLPTPIDPIRAIRWGVAAELQRRRTPRARPARGTPSNLTNY